jgi:hypothetical protein
MPANAMPTFYCGRGDNHWNEVLEINFFHSTSEGRLALLDEGHILESGKTIRMNQTLYSLLLY